MPPRPSATTGSRRRRAARSTRRRGRTARPPSARSGSRRATRAAIQPPATRSAAGSDASATHRAEPAYRSSVTHDSAISRRALLRAMAAGSVAAGLAACGVSVTPSPERSARADRPLRARPPPATTPVPSAAASSTPSTSPLSEPVAHRRIQPPSGQDRADAAGRLPRPGDPTTSDPITAALAAGLGGVILFDRDQIDRRTAQHRVAEAARHADRLAPGGGDRAAPHRHRPGGWQGLAAQPRAGVSGDPHPGRRSARPMTRHVAHAAGLAMGTTMHTAGIDLDLAPVVDVNVNPKNPAIGALGRSFSADPLDRRGDGRGRDPRPPRGGRALDDQALPGSRQRRREHGLRGRRRHQRPGRWPSSSRTTTLIGAGVLDAVMSGNIVNRKLDPDGDPGVALGADDRRAAPRPARLAGRGRHRRPRRGRDHLALQAGRGGRPRARRRQRPARLRQPGDLRPRSRDAARRHDRRPRRRRPRRPRPGSTRRSPGSIGWHRRRRRPEHDISCQESDYHGGVRASRLVSLLLLLQARGQLTAAELAARARGLRADHPSRRRGAQRVGRPDLRGARRPRRDPAGRRLSDAADRDDRRGGRGAVPGRAARARPPSSGSARSSPRPSSRSSPRCRRSCAPGPPVWSNGSTSMPATGSGRASRSPTSARCRTPSGTRPGSRSTTTAASGAARRVLEPLGLVLKAGIWYVVAAIRRPDPHVSRLAGDRRRAGDERFERPAGFDLAAYWAEFGRGLRARGPAHRRRRARAPRSSRPAPRRGRQRRRSRPPSTLDGPDPDGWLRLRLRLDWPDEAPAHHAPRRTLGRGPRPARRPGAGRLDGPRDRRAIRRRRRPDASSAPAPGLRASRCAGSRRGAHAGGRPRARDGVPTDTWRMSPGT